MQKEFLTREELAKLLGYKPQTLAKLPEQFPKFIKRGNKPNGLALYPIEEIKHWLKVKGLNNLIQKLDD